MSLVTYTDKNRYTSTKESRPENPIHPFLVHQYNQAKNKRYYLQIFNHLIFLETVRQTISLLSKTLL